MNTGGRCRQAHRHITDIIEHKGIRAYRCARGGNDSDGTGLGIRRHHGLNAGVVCRRTNEALSPLNLTAVAPRRFNPVIVTFVLADREWREAGDYGHRVKTGPNCWCPGGRGHADRSRRHICGNGGLQRRVVYRWSKGCRKSLKLTLVVPNSFTAHHSAPGTTVTITGRICWNNQRQFNGLSTTFTPPVKQHDAASHRSRNVTTGPISVTTPAGTTNSSGLFYAVPIITGSLHSRSARDKCNYHGVNLLGATAVNSMDLAPRSFRRQTTPAFRPWCLRMPRPVPSLSLPPRAQR